MSQGGNEYEGSYIHIQPYLMQSKLHYSRNKIGLEFVQVNIKRTVKAKGCCDRRYDLCNEAVQIGETGRRDAKTLFADIVNSLVVNLHGMVSVVVKI
jgi:hypothetical protein